MGSLVWWFWKRIKEIGRFVNRDRKNQSADYSILGIKIGEKHDCNIQQRTSRNVLMLTLKNSGESKARGGEKGKVARVYREDNQENALPGISLMPHLSSPSKAGPSLFDR